MYSNFLFTIFWLYIYIDDKITIVIKQQKIFYDYRQQTLLH